MRRDYPYLQDSYKLNSNEELERRKFLQQIDEFANQRQYVRITLLNWEEDPIKDIEGTITGGSLSKDGSSTIRRTGSLSCTVSYGNYDIQMAESDFALNKKIFIEIGVKNDSKMYKEFPILWFPQGVFYIASFSCNSAASGAVNLSIGLKDKMAGLNGDIGGKLPALVILDEVITQLPNGTEAVQKVPIYSIIQETVNHYGGEPLANIVIEDIPARIRMVMRWMGENPLYLIDSADNHYQEDAAELSADAPYYQFQLEVPSQDDYLTFEAGDDVGYIMSDFVMPNEFTMNAGSAVTDILDTIVSTLGNYEYFYDVFGVFHFREIKNYVNTTQGKLVLKESSQNQYLVETNNDKNEYLFTDTGNITSINVTPNYDNIKNDYVILGMRKSAVSDQAYEVRYHLAIDDKPEVVGKHSDGYYYYGTFGDIEGQILVFYSEKEDGEYTGNIIGDFCVSNMEVGSVAAGFSGFPTVGNVNRLYWDNTEGDPDTSSIYAWNGETYEKVWIYSGKDDNGNDILTPPIIFSRYTDAGTYYVRDWRTYLYLQGRLAEINGTQKNFYYEELAAHWPTIYDMINQRFWTEYREELLWSDDYNMGRYTDIKDMNIHRQWRTLADGNYYLDFIDAKTSGLGQYSVGSIGRRTEVVNDEKINCLFEPEIPNVDILNIDDLEYNTTQSTMLKGTTTLAEQRAESIQRGQPYTQVGNEIYSNLSIGAYSNPAYDELKYQLYLHTNFQRQVAITALPAFYLEPNTRIEINEKSTNTYGNFIVSNIGLTLGPGANMSISASEIFERD